MWAATEREADEVFLFVNPNSGGHVGEVFLRVPQPFTVHLDGEDSDSDNESREVSLRIFNLLEAKGSSQARETGFRTLREVAAKGVVRVIAGGGDGTVMWVVSEAERHGIDPRTQLRIGIVPLGTGNDFSQALGWGGHNPDKDALLAKGCQELRYMVREWCAATPALHDVWCMRMQVDEDKGTIYQKEDALVDEDGSLRRSVVTPMLLYAGVAKDAELAYKVEIHRTKSQFCNKLVYAWQGICVSMHWFCCKSQRVRRVISGLYSGTSSEDEPIFEYGAEHEHSEAPTLLTNPEMLLFLNIDSFAGGEARRLWQTSFRLGVDRPLDQGLLECSQDCGDKRLEVLTLRRLLRAVMPTNRLLGGRRVFQGAPLHLTFRQKPKMTTYCQVDGESYKLRNPKSLTIEHKQQIVVLYREAGKPGASWFTIKGLCGGGLSDEADSDGSEF